MTRNTTELIARVRYPYGAFDQTHHDLANALESTVKEMHARELHHFEEEKLRAEAEAKLREAERDNDLLRVALEDRNDVRSQHRTVTHLHKRAHVRDVHGLWRKHPGGHMTDHENVGYLTWDEFEPRDEKIADLIWDVMRETGAEPKFMHDEHGQLDPDGVFLAIAQKLLATGLPADVENTKEGT